MRFFLFLISLFIFTSIQAAVVNSMLIDGSDYKLLSILNNQDSGYVYAENNQHRKILIYKSPHPYQPNSVFSSEQLGNTNILEVGFECYNPVCTRYLNRRTSELSDIYTDILDYDAKKDVIAYYQRDKNLVVISRAFKICKKPLVYVLKIYPESTIGTKTYFLKNGDLQFDYADTQGNEHRIKVFHINYPKLLNDCTKG